MREPDVAHCRALLGAGSKSFGLASKLLPRVVRERATVLYAFCRVADDLVDDDPGAGAATIARLRKRLASAYAGRPIDDPVDRALADVLADTQIPPAIPEALLEGMEWDLEGRRYRSLAELEAYAARVAGTVGVMMTIAMGVRGATALARACDLGVAMQLTNVARDVGADARMGRVYLPADWLDGVAVDRFSPALGRVIERLLVQADVLYLRADRGVPLLPGSCRTAIRAARLIYSDIGRDIRRHGFDTVSRRARVSTPRKLWLALRAAARRFDKVSTEVEMPPLEATRPLVEACST